MIKYSNLEHFLLIKIKYTTNMMALHHYSTEAFHSDHNINFIPNWVHKIGLRSP